MERRAAVCADTESLWQAFREPLRRYFRSRLRQPSAVDDLVQEVFLRVHGRIDTLRDPLSVAPWLFRIAHHVLVDHLRTDRRMTGADELAEAAAEEPDQEPEEALAPAVRAMVDRLAPSYRQAIELTEYGGLSQVELARRLGISVSGAKSRVPRARGMLRQMLVDCCHFELDRRGGIAGFTARPTCCSVPRQAR